MRYTKARTEHAWGRAPACSTTDGLGQRGSTVLSSPIAAVRTQPAQRGRSGRNGGRSRNPSLANARLQRALRRQWWVAILIALGLGGVGGAIETAIGTPAPLAMTMWAFIGGGAGLTVALIRELGRNTITSLTSLGKHRGYAVLGAAPELTPQTLRALPPDSRSAIGCLAFLPASSFATAFRDLQETIAKKKRVAFIGAVSGEGATMSALCAAISATQQGRTVVIIDCDLRHRGLTRALAAEPDAGVLEACQHPHDWRRFVFEEAETGLLFIPAVRTQNAWRSLSTVPGFSELLDRLDEEFDLIVLDCPPALTSADGIVVAQKAELGIVVATWDRTRLNALRAVMRRLRPRNRPATGVYVNRVPRGYRFGRLRPD